MWSTPPNPATHEEEGDGALVPLGHGAVQLQVPRRDLRAHRVPEGGEGPGGGEGVCPWTQILAWQWLPSPMHTQTRKQPGNNRCTSHHLNAPSHDLGVLVDGGVKLTLLVHVGGRDLEGTVRRHLVLYVSQKCICASKNEDDS